MSLDLNQTYKELQAAGEKKAVKGGCHCGAIEYEVKIRVSPDGSFRATRCNCTFCQKFGTCSLSPESRDDFKLLQPSTKQEISGDYTKYPDKQHRYFCSVCGVHCFQEGVYEYEGQSQEFFLVNVGSFSQPQEEVIDVNQVKISYWDGLHYNWAAGMKDTPWPNGLP